MKNILDSSSMQSLKSLLSEWDYISKRKENINLKFLLPNYFFVINPEISIEVVVDLMTDCLEEHKLIEFEGPVHSYLFNLTYSDVNDNEFYSFKKFYQIFTKHLSKFGETFKGILVIDITEWIENNECNSKKFIAFLDFMSSIDDETMAVFVSRASNDVKNKEAMQILLTKSRVRRVDIGEVGDDDGLIYVCELLKEGNISINEDAKESLKEVVKFILNVDGNEGLKSLHQLVNDIIYDKLASKDENINMLTVQDLEKYSPNNEWAQNYKNTRKKYLGLIGD